MSKEKFTTEELKAQGFVFYTLSELSEKFNFDFSKSKDRKRDLRNKVKGDYEFFYQKGKKSEGTVAGAWLKEINNTASFYEANFRVDKAENLDILTHFMCENYHCISTINAEEMARACRISKSTVYDYLKDLRDLGVISPILPKEKRLGINEWSGEVEEKEVEVNNCVYFYRGYYGVPVFTTKYMYGKQIREMIKYLISEYGDYKLINSPDHYREAQHEFRKRNGFLIEKRYDIRPNPAIMEKYGYEITEDPYETKVDLEMIPFVIEEKEEFEVVEPQIVNVVEIKPIDKKEPKLELAFGTSTKMNFEAITLESSFMDGSFLYSA